MLNFAMQNYNKKMDYASFTEKKALGGVFFLLGAVISVLFGGDAGSMFEIAIERGGFVEAEHKSYLFECSLRLCFDESFGLGDDILLDPLAGRGAAGSLSDDLGEILRREVEHTCVELNLLGLGIMRDDGFAELMEQEGILIHRPVFVLFSPVEIEHFVTDSQLREDEFVSVRQFVKRVFGERVQVFNDGQNSLRLQVGEGTRRCIVELLKIVAESIKLQVMIELRRDDDSCEGIVM